jgi:hypothetical protein
MIASSRKARLSHFKVRFADGTDYSGALYANGHHQCEIVVEVLKEAMGKVGSWHHVVLSDEERASIRIVPAQKPGYRSNSEGWVCDTEKNEFSLGLWSRQSKEDSDNVSIPNVLDSRIEVFSRYMRVAQSASLEPREFMATIVLEGELLFESFSEKSAGADSSIVIAPVAPCQLRITDLDSYVDYNAYSDNNVSVDIYGWQGKDGLRFVQNYGLLKPLPVSGEGQYFQTAYGVQSNFKGGIFKGLPDSVQPLLITMIHHLPPATPPPDPTVRWQFVVDMMAARLRAFMSVLPESTEPAFWTLRDNFGTLRCFKLYPTEGGNRLSLEPVSEPSKRVAHFRIRLPNGQDSTSELYANNRHQCKVTVEVIADEEGADGIWRPVPLKPEEEASITVTRYSANLNEPLPRGWSCDAIKNIYDTGLRARSPSLAQEQPLQEQHQAIALPAHIETFDRFMRFDSSTPIEYQRFMARIVINGKVYTTNYRSGEDQFDSWVSITPVRPYVLKVDDLNLTVDEHAYSDLGTQTDIDVYYWTPPAGLSFLVNRGVDSPMNVSLEGDYFHTSFSNLAGRDYLKGGVVVSKDNPALQLRLKDIHRGLPEVVAGYNPFVRFGLVNTIMRAVRVSSANAIDQGHRTSPWRLWDNFGCEHAFLIKRDTHRLLLQDHN